MPARIKLTENQIQEMYRLRSKEKMSYGDIGEQFGVSKQTVKRRMKEYVYENGLNEGSLSLDHQFDKFFFHDIDTSEKAYWLGFVTADGYLNEENATLSIKLSNVDRHHLEKLLDAVRAQDVPIRSEVNNLTGNLEAVICLCGKDITAGLKKQGIEQGKSQHEKVPVIREEFVRDFIRGLWDGDGHISNSKIGMCSSYEVCKWVQEKLHEHCGTPINKVFFDSNIYKIYVVKTQIDVLKWLYYPGCKEMALDRKYKAAKLKTLRAIKKCRLKNINDNIQAVQSGNTLEIMNGELNGKLPLGQSEIEGAA